MSQQTNVQAPHGWQVTDMTFYENENDASSSQQSVSLLPQNASQQDQINSDQSLSEVSRISEEMTPEQDIISNNVSNKDRFENIFYTVSDDKEKNKLCILFATKDLYANFLINFQKGFQEQESDEERRTFRFHVQKQTCTVTPHDEDCGIIVKGQAYKLWRQTGFMKLATKLYRQYVIETNESLGINEETTLLPPPSYASTPCINRHTNDPPITPMQNMRQTQDPLEQIIKSQAEMKDQTASLMEMVINLQEQVQKINSSNMEQINSSNREQSQVQQHDAGDPSDSTTEEVVHIDVTGENMPPTKVTVPGDLQYSEAVERMISDAENMALQQCRTDASRTQTQRNPAISNENKTLLIGDSLLSAVNRKGLKNNVHCAPFPGATIDVISRSIIMYDLTQFKNIIIYCGGNDSAKSNNMEHFKKGYETLLNHIKKINPGCNVYVCSSCPRGDTDTTDINKLIKSVAAEHGATFVDTNSAFYDYNNELRTKFYKPRDWIHLSNSGTKRLLGTINSVLPIVENFKYCVHPQHSENVTELSNTHRDRKTSYHGTRPRGQHGRRAPNSTSQSGGAQQAMRNNQDTGSSYAGRHRSADHHHDKDDHRYHHRDTPQYTYQNEHYDQNRNYGTFYDRDEYYGHHFDTNSYKNVERCMKCGLTNHTTGDCRHKRQLLCYSCNYYGHKDSICWNK